MLLEELYVTFNAINDLGCEKQQPQTFHNKMYIQNTQLEVISKAKQSAPVHDVPFIKVRLCGPPNGLTAPISSQSPCELRYV